MRKIINDTLNTNWKKILLDKLIVSSHLGTIYDTLDCNIFNDDIEYYPKTSDVLKSLNYFDIKDTKVVIIGQDPYPSTDKRGIPYACGLSFSYNKDIKDIKAKNSLKSIFKEIGDGRTDTNLEDWARQGVLLLNTILTVSPGKVNSHVSMGWELFTDFILIILSLKVPNAIYLLLGKKAQKKIKAIRRYNKNAIIIIAGHPSPLNRTGSFIGSNCFNKINDELIKLKLKSIKWV